MDKETTRSLSRILEKISENREADRFLEESRSDQPTNFHTYINQMIGEKNLQVSEVIRRSGISRNYVYNILNGYKQNPGRDKVIALCVGACLTYSETQKGLELAKTAILYPRDHRDVRIAVAINQGICDVGRLNLLLEECGLPPLKV